MKPPPRLPRRISRSRAPESPPKGAFPKTRAACGRPNCFTGRLNSQGRTHLPTVFAVQDLRYTHLAIEKDGKDQSEDFYHFTSKFLGSSPMRSEEHTSALQS